MPGCVETQFLRNTTLHKQQSSRRYQPTKHESGTELGHRFPNLPQLKKREVCGDGFGEATCVVQGDQNCCKWLHEDKPNQAALAMKPDSRKAREGPNKGANYRRTPQITYLPQPLQESYLS